MSVELSTSGAGGAGGEIFYTWKYLHGIDKKRRIQMPARWRPAQPEVKLSVTLWPHGNLTTACLMVMPYEKWMKLFRTVQAISLGDPKAEKLRRTLGQQSMLLDLDRAGRLHLEEKMVTEAGIENEALLIGLVDCFQIWNPARYETVRIEDEAAVGEAFKLI